MDFHSDGTSSIDAPLAKNSSVEASAKQEPAAVTVWGRNGANTDKIGKITYLPIAVKPGHP
eukprot:4402603-Amphidinium_carterae.1